MKIAVVGIVLLCLSPLALADDDSALISMCSQGNGIACLGYAAIQKTKTDSDAPNRVWWAYANACRKELADACVETATFFFLGKGPVKKPNLSEYAARAAKACNLGSATGCGQLGRGYYTGVAPFRKDVELGLKLLSHGCFTEHKQQTCAEGSAATRADK